MTYNEFFNLIIGLLFGGIGWWLLFWIILFLVKIIVNKKGFENLGEIINNFLKKSMLKTSSVFVINVILLIAIGISYLISSNNNLVLEIYNLILGIVGQLFTIVIVSLFFIHITGFMVWNWHIGQTLKQSRFY